MTPAKVTASFRAPGPGGWPAELARLGRSVPAPLGLGPAPRHRRVLIPLLVGASDLFLVREGLIGHALRLRGADVVYVLCDGLPTCDARTHDADPADLCENCRAHGREVLAAFGHRTVPLSAFLDRGALDAARAEADALAPEALLDARRGGIALGDFIYASTLRYFRSGAFDARDPVVAAKARETLAGALLMTDAVRRAYARLRPSKVFSSHGIYASWGPWQALARAMNISYDSYSGGWRRGTLLCHHDAARGFHCDDLWPQYEDRPLTVAEHRRLASYLASREDNAADFFQYFQQLDRDLGKLGERLGIALEGWRRRVGVFTNVAYDAASRHPRGAFDGMFDWLVEAVRLAAARPDTLVLVKTHPAERRFIEQTPDRWAAGNVLRRAFDPLPPNVRIIEPDDNVSTHALYAAIDLGLVYTSSVGLEMAARGLPVLTPGAGVHYEKPRIVLAAGDRASYEAQFEALLADPGSFRPDPERLARYAYTLYFRKSLPFDVLDVRGWEAVGIAIDNLAELAPGRFPGLDALCDAILEDAPFAAPPLADDAPETT